MDIIRVARTYAAETQNTMTWAVLTGANMRHARQNIMTAIVGRRVPAAQCGINNVVRALLDAFNIDRASGCMAVLEMELAKAACHTINVARERGL